MKIVALLQNQWFKDPERSKKLLSMYENLEPECGRERFIRDFLFFGCLTGKRLGQTFQDVFDLEADGEWRFKIIWEEVSTEIGGKSSSAFPPDPLHIYRVLQKHKPEVVILFGKVAQDGFLQAARLIEEKKERFNCHLIYAPHPAARGVETIPRLLEAAAELKAMLDKERSKA